MGAYQKPVFIPGPRLQDGTDLTNLGNALGIRTVIIPIQLAHVADAEVYKIAIPYPFKVTKAGFRTASPVTTAAKLTTLTTGVNGTAMTGGVMSLTSANQAATGTLTAGTAITAKNTGVAGDEISITASSTTAFVEGDGWVELTVQNL